MGISSGPNTFERGLSFGFDTGHGESDNTTPTRYNKGEPTVNFVTIPFEKLGNDGSGQSSVGTKTTISTNHVRIVDVGSNTRQSHLIQGLTPNTVYTVSVQFKKIYGTPTFRFQLQGYSGSSYVNTIKFTNTSETGLTNISGWQTAKWTFTLPSNCNGLRIWWQDGADYTTYTHSFELKNPQLESKGYVTPFIDGTRSTTKSLIDLKKTIDIDTSNVSFDSTGQPVFDGTDDNIILNPSTKWAIGQDGTIEMMVKPTNSTGNDRLWCVDNNSTSLDAYLNGTTYNVYLHGGVVGTNTPLILNSWNYLVVTYSGGEIQIYINGSEAVMNGNTTGYNITNGGTLFLGSFPNPSYNLYGSVGFFKLHKGSITFEEVKQNYNSQKNRFDI